MRSPTLILQGDKDSVVDAAGAGELAARLELAREVLTYPQSDHLLTLDADRAKVFDDVCAFFGASNV